MKSKYNAIIFEIESIHRLDISDCSGKTHLVTQLSNFWNLRMIAVKGPELLAKFIGQSEENVRNIFER